MSQAKHIRYSCGFCGTQFWPNKKSSRFCSISCGSKARTGERSARWSGGLSLSSNGYIVIPRSEVVTSQSEHRLIAEKAFGKPLPPEVVVHHHDENRTHNENSNLVICQDRAYHLLIHKRMRVLKAGGDPNKDKFCCGECKSLRPFSDFHKTSSNEDGMDSQCKLCKKLRRARAVERARDSVKSVINIGTTR